MPEVATADKTDATTTQAGGTSAGGSSAAGGDKTGGQGGATQDKGATTQTQDQTKTETKTLLGGAVDTDKKNVGAPEKYADFKLPDGLTADKGLLDKFTALARKKNFSQEDAQEFVTLQAEHAKAGMDALVQEVQRKDAEIRENWKQETIKVLGADFQKELAFAAKALDRFGTPQTRQFLEETGLGNHPALAQLLIAAGKAISEDTFVNGRTAGGGSDDQASLRKTFPTMFKEDGSPAWK